MHQKLTEGRKYKKQHGENLVNRNKSNLKKKQDTIKKKVTFEKTKKFLEIKQSLKFLKLSGPVKQLTKTQPKRISEMSYR